MQDMNHDMEELLRRAAVNYPLNSGEDRWEEIGNRLSRLKENNKPPRRRFQRLWSVLLLILFLFSVLFLNQYAVHHQTLDATRDNTKSVTTDTREHAASSNDLIVARGPGISTSTIENPAKTWSVQNSPGTAGFSTVAETSDKTNVQLVNYIPVHRTVKHYYDADEEFKKQLRQYQPSNQYHAETVLKTAHRNQVGPGRFYYGLSGSLHLSAVKELKFQRTGYDAGVYGGYRTGTKTSIETGLLFSKKYYWTPGKYFSMDAMQSSMSPGMEMMEVDGSSMIFEVPVHFNYIIHNKGNQSCFMSTGFSSFFMTEEKNQYSTMMNGVPSKMYGNYRENRNYFAASFDVGFGFEQQVGSRAILRVEPWLQLPIRSVGIGQLPVKSAGLRLGLARNSK